MDLEEKYYLKNNSKTMWNLTYLILKSYEGYEYVINEFFNTQSKDHKIMFF